MNYIKIINCDIANGHGVRTTLFVSGCDHCCKGCQNPQTWDANAGQEFTFGKDGTADEIIESLKPDYIRGLSLSGGDPLYSENRAGIAQLCKNVRAVFGHSKDIWLWTGYTFEDLITEMTHNIVTGKDLISIMRDVDVIVDGPFIQEQRDITLPYCGSRNQRVIDVQKTLNAYNIVLWNKGE